MLLPFSKAEFFAAFGSYNLAVWPAQWGLSALVPILWAFIGSTAAILLGVAQDYALLAAGLWGLALPSPTPRMAHRRGGRR